MKVPVQVFKGFVLAGRLNLDDRGGFDHFLDSIGDTKVEVTVRVATHKENRSIEANRFYWAAVVSEFVRGTGHTAAEVHVALKNRFLVSPEAGIEPSSAALSPKEFSDYVEQCIHLAVEMGFQIDTSNRPVVSMPRSARKKIGKENNVAEE
jgi:hypothetical protein